MISLSDNPMDMLKRQAIRFMLVAMGTGSALTTVLHRMNPQTPSISRIIPPLTLTVCVCLLIYLLKHPQSSQRIIYILLAWSFAIIVFPEYLFLFTALSDPSQHLMDILPPWPLAFFC